MNKIIVIALSSIALVGCVGTNPGPINVNPVAALNSLVNTNSGFNPGTINPALAVEAAANCPQVGSVNVMGPGVNFSWNRNAPPGYVPQPIVPSTPDRVALIEADYFASQIYALRNNRSSDDVTFSGGGWMFTLHMAYPPSTLNTNAPIQVEVVNTSANPVPSVVSTNAPAK